MCLRSFYLQEKNGARNYLNHDLITMPCLLMKVTKKKSSEKKKLDAEILGHVEKIYSFQKIADFQYLPMCTTIVPKSQATPKSNEKKQDNESWF